MSAIAISGILHNAPKVDVVSSTSTSIMVKVDTIGSKDYERNFMGFGVISSGVSQNGGEYMITEYFLPERSAFTITNLHPYSIYRFEVYTKTQTITSPRSTISSVLTEESGKLKIIVPLFRCVIVSDPLHWKQTLSDIETNLIK